MTRGSCASRRLALCVLGMLLVAACDGAEPDPVDAEASAAGEPSTLTRTIEEGRVRRG